MCASGYDVRGYLIFTQWRKAAVPISPMNSRRRIPAPKDPIIVAV